MIEKLSVQVSDLAGSGVGSLAVARWLYMVAVFLVSLAALIVIRHILIKRLEQWSKKTKNDVDDLIIGIVRSWGKTFYIFLALLFSLKVSGVGVRALDFISRFSFVIIAFYLVRAVSSVLGYSFKKYVRARSDDVEGDEYVVTALNRILQIVLWIIAGIIVLQNFGYNVSAVVGGLGVAGIAVAIAVQNVLEDVLSFFSMYFDKPVALGDFVVLGDTMGTVENIGLKSTRLRSIEGEQVVISNKQVISSELKNYGKMKERTEIFQFGVRFDTPKKKLEKIPDILEEVIKSQKNIEFNRAHFKEIGESALIFEVMYCIKTADYDAFMDARQEINLQIIDHFEKEGIILAYPTSTVKVEK